ncbi:MAG: nucleotidyltransferase family protein [Spirulinaceae cyanobacterium]
MNKPVLTSGILSQEQIQTLLKQFLEERGEEFGLTALGYFGSYARQEAKPDSDVDIVFETCKPNLFATIRLQGALSDRLNRPVDLIRLHQYLSPKFKERVQREVIYV